MKTKRNLCLFLALVLIVATFTACNSGKETNAEPVWSIAVEGAEAKEFTNIDYDKLEKTQFDVVKNKKDGTSVEESWKGVLLKDVLDYLGITEYSSITLTASDDFSKDYTQDIIEDKLTFLGTSVDGEELTADDGYVEAVAGSQSSNMWIKNLVKITVNK